MVAPTAAAAGPPFLEWKEVEDEAHSADCVTVDVPLPKHVTAKDLEVELHLRTLRVRANGKLVFEDRFAEEGWLSLDDSYWEFVPEGPVLRYFLLKNAEFQREPLYCLFEAELFDKGEGAEDLDDPSNDTEELDDESAEADDKRMEEADCARMEDAPPAMKVEAADTHSDESTLREPEGQTDSDAERASPPAAMESQAEGPETTPMRTDETPAQASFSTGGGQGGLGAQASVDDAAMAERTEVAALASSTETTGATKADESCPRVPPHECGADASTPEDSPVQKAEMFNQCAATKDESNCNNVGKPFKPNQQPAASADAASCPRSNDHEQSETDSSTVDMPVHDAEIRDQCAATQDGSNSTLAFKPPERRKQRGSQHLAGVILRAVEVAEQVTLLHKKNLSICVMASSTGDAEASEDFDSLQQEECAELSVTIVGFKQTTTSQSGSTSGVSMRRLYGQRDCNSILQECGHIDILYLPSGLLESWYYYSALLVRTLAARGALVVAAGPPNGRLSDTRLAATESILGSLGCQISVPCCQSQGLGTGQQETFCCVQGLAKGTSPLEAAADDDDALHKWYLPLRRTLAGQGIDFRPLYPAPDVVEKACAAARAAHFAWSAIGASHEEAAVAAGISAGEYQLASMMESGQHGSCCIHAAVSSAVRGAIEVGAAEFRAAAVGALMGLREGVFAWDRCRPLEIYGAEVANIVGTTLAAEGLWKNFPEDIRRRKIWELINAGGLRRPGECTIALCQALLGVNRPKGGSRLVAAMGILRKVSEILLVAASLPNLLDAGGTEVSTFSAIVLESVNKPRLSKLLTDMVD